MSNHKHLLIWITVFALALSACAGAGQPKAAATDAMMDKPTEAMMDKPTEAMMEKPTEAMMEKPTEAMMDKPTEAMMDKPTETMMETPVPETMKDDKMMSVPAWFGAALTDVNRGETFSIGDLKGKVVLVETLAMWCSNCLKQQKQVLALHAQLGERDDFVSLGLDIDPNEDGAALQAYTQKNGFNWKYAIAPAEVSRELGQLYGDQFLNPPSTPMLIIDRHGEVHPLPFGIKSAEALLKALQPFLDEGM
ncbi:MAG: TlpA disulfide reductase family protein [Chloroflexota bacterium]